MGTYSPVGPDADLDAERKKLVRLIEEAWPLADADSPLDVSRLDAAQTFFILFHAGIGRDVELLGTVLEKTPLDLPSLYFGEDALTRFGATGLQFGTLPVTNTAIIPRTESRLGYNGITQDSLLLELSINGLLASSFLSFLGIPDLFNTDTGESAIGAFGLMDPQGIFAYAGLLPPMPTAWTRLRLGWLAPVELSGPGPVEVTLPPGAAARAAISPVEYFLVEHRRRDRNGDGLVLRVWQHGTEVEQRIPAITDDFNRFSVEGFAGGVVVGADDYDFALPGRDADGNQYEGGILIWHVDERVIATGAVNADPDHRGLDLEEADAAQDLGYDNTPGTPFDFFFAGNPVRAVLPDGRDIRFYENRFGPGTRPSSAANGGGASFIALSEFSAPGNEMRFTYRQEAVHGLLPEKDVALNVPIGPGSSVGGSGDFTWVFTPEAPARAHVVMGDSAYVLETLVRPVARGDAITVLQAEQGTYVLKTFMPPSREALHITALPVSAATYAPRGTLARSEHAEAHMLFGNDSNSLLVTVGEDGTVTEQTFPAGGEGLAVTSDGRPLVIGTDYVVTADGTMLWSIGEHGLPAFGYGIGGLWGAMTNPDRIGLTLLDPDLPPRMLNAGRYLPHAAQLSDFVAVADIHTDGMHEVVASAGPHLLAFERGGALADGFPVTLDAPVAGQPLVALRADGSAIIIAATASGLIHAVAPGGPVPGFPLSVGGTIHATPRLSEGLLEVVTADGVLRSYAVAEAWTVLWGEQHMNSSNTNFGASPRPSVVPRPDKELVAGSETYNWPNPVREGRTFLRTMTWEDARVVITIVDMAGTAVFDAAFDVLCCRPVEVLWEAAVESGLYFARVQATVADGRTQSRLIRIAVIR